MFCAIMDEDFVTTACNYTCDMWPMATTASGKYVATVRDGTSIPNG